MRHEPYSNQHFHVNNDPDGQLCVEARLVKDGGLIVEIGDQKERHHVVFSGDPTDIERLVNQVRAAVLACQ